MATISTLGTNTLGSFTLGNNSRPDGKGVVLNGVAKPTLLDLPSGVIRPLPKGTKS